jgi:uncharacterized protein (TIGR00375 family)
MPFFADLHLHSRYSIATSRDMTPEGIWKWAQLKGVTVTGTGDFTHPAWRRDLGEKLFPAGNGLFQLKEEHRPDDGVPASCRSDVFFLLSAEISCVYRKNGRTRKVHCLVLVPGFAEAELIASRLARIGNIASDGRPILGLDAKDLLGIVLDAAPDAVFVPAHAWTPHFSVFGAASGFDSLEECFEELTPEIRAIETGLSSDPPMNRRLSRLDRLALISNSDAHSPSKLGREANIFDTDISYDGIARAIKDGEGLLGTIEFFPEEGKYHYDGHRACGISYHPEESLRRRCLCPVCGRRLTIGVMHRVQALADRDEASVAPRAPAYRSVIPLAEVIAEAKGLRPSTKGVSREYLGLLTELGSEFKVLLETSIADIGEVSHPLVAEAVRRMRDGTVSITPGYDGEYGRVRILGDRKGME